MQSSVIEMLLDDDAVGSEEVVSDVYVGTAADDSTQPVSVANISLHFLCRDLILFTL